MRRKNDPRIKERARMEEEYTASFHKTLQRVDSLEAQSLKGGRERDERKENNIDDERKNKEQSTKQRWNI